MKLTLSEAREQIKLAKSMPPDARAAMLKNLKAAQVVEVAEDGTESAVTLEIDIIEPEQKSAAADPVAIKAAIKAEQISQPIVQPTAGIVFPTQNVSVKSFKSDDFGRAHEKAYKFGMWAAATAGIGWGKAFCQKHGIGLHADIETKGQTEGTNTAGGYLVPPEFSSELIKLVLEYGVARRLFRTRPMSRDTLSIPRRTGGLTAYFVGEASAGTASQMAFDQVQLVAKKLMTLSLVSSEVNEDAVISWADQLADEASRAIAYKEDLCGFLGTGTSTYGGIVGISTALGNLNGTDEGGGLILGSGNAYSELTLADFHRVVGRTPSYARAGAVWVVSPSFHDAVMQRLQTAAGGNQITQVAGGGIMNQFLGYPVVLSEVMPTTEANSQICALFGNFAQAVSFGDRKQMTMSMSEHATVGGVSVFETDQYAVRVTERFDIVAHDIGTASVAGPVVGLITAGS